MHSLVIGLAQGTIINIVAMGMKKVIQGRIAINVTINITTGHHGVGLIIIIMAMLIIIGIMAIISITINALLLIITVIQSVAKGTSIQTIIMRQGV
ncbi:MAG: hypothetical protein COB62_02975 [Piscirickettsiaceae bacterium]|nr:MAG: hypothetical protein COB62_02975 [Piscirickettsiaceae bacterium]